MLEQYHRRVLMLVLPLLPVIPFFKLFHWDDAPLKGLVHNLFCEHKLVEPVIIRLKEADFPHLIYVNVPVTFLRRTVSPFPQQARGTPVEAASVSLAACFAER
jgi:hypothetical protein